MKNKNDLLKSIKEALGYKNLNLENFDEFVKYEGDHTYLIYGDEYIISTDEEADSLTDDYLNDYIEEHIIKVAETVNLSKCHLRIDLIKDELLLDGRGTWLAGYDGDELCGGDFYLYKQNVNNKVEKNVTNSKDLFGYTTNLQKTI